MSEQPEPISTPLREAARQVESRRALARSADVDPATVTRFCQGGRIRIDQADRLAAVLGLELQPKRKRKS